MRRLLPFLLLVLTLMFGCHGRAPRVAPGFRRAGVAALRIGVPVQELTHALGVPLTIDPDDSRATEQVYHYAIRGGDLEVFRHRIWAGTGPACAVTVRSGVVAEVLLRTSTACTCAIDSCPPSWAAECLADVPN